MSTSAGSLLRRAGASGHEIDTAGMKWMASAEPGEREPAAAQQPVGGNGLGGVVGAGRIEAALPPY